MLLIIHLRYSYHFLAAHPDFHCHLYSDFFLLVNAAFNLLKKQLAQMDKHKSTNPVTKRPLKRRLSACIPVKKKLCLMFTHSYRLSKWKHLGVSPIAVLKLSIQNVNHIEFMFNFKWNMLEKKLHVILSLPGKNKKNASGILQI